MSHSLSGKRAGDVLTEFWGPHNGRNYFVQAAAAVDPQLRFQIFGTDSGTTIIVEENTTLEFVGTNNSGAIGSSPVRGAKLLPTRAAADWTEIGVGAPYDITNGLVTLTLTARDNPYGIRVRVVAIGGDPERGSVAVATEWN